MRLSLPVTDEAILTRAAAALTFIATKRTNQRDFTSIPTVEGMKFWGGRRGIYTGGMPVRSSQKERFSRFVLHKRRAMAGVMSQFFFYCFGHRSPTGTGRRTPVGADGVHVHACTRSGTCETNVLHSTRFVGGGIGAQSLRSVASMRPGAHRTGFWRNEICFALFRMRIFRYYVIFVIIPAMCGGNLFFFFLQ